MKRERILIVEDDPFVSDLLTEVLTNDGNYEVTTTESALGAAGLIRDIRPAAVLLDIGLPYLPGTELLEELKADERTADVPVVIVTGLPETLSEQRRVMAAAVLSKPVDPTHLLTVLGQI